ncbi:MAG: hypothetical protein KZQ81_05900 [Candidatus Thiodiazotropha sp. (ex Rostrolucina anterorostrata)]|nr:hypothetical protein [Candidatus Thiodiazotropha sp. (ex Rostrolucina anterorostrata)]
MDSEEIEHWGYKVHNISTFDNQFCAGGSESIYSNSISIKSIASIEDDNKIYYRFTLVKEKYASEKEAEIRLNRLKNPGVRTTKHAKLCDIIKSFRIGLNIYFVHTNVGRFKNEMARVTTLYAKAVQNYSG